MITVNNAPQIVAHLIAESETQKAIARVYRSTEDMLHYGSFADRVSEELLKRAKQIDIEFGISLRQQ